LQLHICSGCVENLQIPTFFDSSVATASQALTEFPHTTVGDFGRKFGNQTRLEFVRRFPLTVRENCRGPVSFLTFRESRAKNNTMTS